MASFLKIKVPGLSHLRNVVNYNGHNIKRFFHKKGLKKEDPAGKRFAELIENILKKA